MDYSQLAHEQQEELLNSGIALLRTITEIWGADVGMEMWDNIADTVGVDFKGAVFFSLMTGRNVGPVRLINMNGVQQYVEVIKCVRNYTGLGLKDAKDLCDHVRAGGVEKITLGMSGGDNTVATAQRAACVKRLRDLGCQAE